MKNLVLFGAIALLLSCSGVEENKGENRNETKGVSAFYNFKTKTLAGNDFDFASLKGKKVLIVNTASECGYTKQYKDLQELYDKYGGGDFEIVGFPSNNFGEQEPGTDKQIAEFCEKNYGVSFTMLSKSDVVGANQNELYKWLTQAALNGKSNAEVKWNFHKFLVDETGRWVQSLPSGVSPLDEIVIGFALIK